jgi:hypothetical protein
MRVRVRDGLVGVATLACLVSLLAEPALGALSNLLAADQPCPTRPLTARPTALHFQPGLVQHESWVEAPVPEPDATDFVLCVDSRLLGSETGETPQNGRVRASVRTALVDSLWLLHQLDDYRAADRWELRYTTYALERRASTPRPATRP